MVSWISGKVRAEWASAPEPELKTSTAQLLV